MADKTFCEQCIDTMATQKCDTCGKNTCDECGRTVESQGQSGSSLNAVIEKWQCNACEFGP